MIHEARPPTLNPQNLFGGLSTACDFVDLVQPGDYSVTAFPAQNGFFTPPVVHQEHDLALARPPLQGLT